MADVTFKLLKIDSIIFRAGDKDNLKKFRQKCVVYLFCFFVCSVLLMVFSTGMMEKTGFSLFIY